MFISIVAFPKLWLTFCDEADYFNCGRPSVLNQCAVLNFDLQPRKLLSFFGVDIVFVYIVNAAVACVLRALYVVVLL